jgi:colicin import membrane protein
VAWRSHAEDAQEAELWSAIPEAEAPPPAPVVVPPPTEAPPPEPPPPVAEPVPDLVIGKKPAKEPKVKPERKPAEPKEVFDSTPPKPRKADPTQPPPDLRARQLKEAKDAKEAKDKAARELAAQEKLAKQQAEQAAAALEAQRLRNLSDIVKRAGGGQGSANASGQAARSAGPSAGYRGRLIALFRRNIINFAIDDVPGNPEAVVDLVLAPDGTILSKTLRTPSGVASWDEAVLRAIDRTEMLPPDETGRVQPRMTIGFKPKDY